MINHFANPANQSVRSGPLSNGQQRCRGRGLLFSRGRLGKQLFSKSVFSAESGNIYSKSYPRIHPVMKKMLYAENIQNFQPAERHSVFPEKLKKVNKRFFHFRVSEEISDPISIRTISNNKG